MVTNVRGELGKVSGTINLDDKDITKSTVEATIEVAAINTRDAKRDEHLRSPDFFDVAKFPNITFKSTKVEKAGAGLKVTGTLTIRGVSKEVALSVDGPAPAVKDPWGNTKSGFTATVKLNRKDFGVQWNKSLDGGGVVVSDDVNVTIDLEVLKKK
jgi:polyisoprenoid-binding protein YceI